MDDVLTKSDVRGKRSNRGYTRKKFERHYFDDEANDHSRKAAGKRGHSRVHPVEEQLDDVIDDPYSDIIDVKKIK